MGAPVEPGPYRGGVGRASYPWGVFRCRLITGKIDRQKTKQVAIAMVTRQMQ